MTQEKGMKKLKWVLPALLAAALVLAPAARTGSAKAVSFDRFEERFVSPVTLDDFARTTAETEGDPTVTVTGDAVMSTPSMSFTYGAQNPSTMMYASANKSNIGKKYAVIRYTATAGVKNTHFGVKMQVVAGGATTDLPDKPFSQLYAPEADEAGIQIDTSGEDALMIIDLNATWNLNAPTGPAYVNNFFVQFYADTQMTETATFTVKEIYRTDVPTSTGYSKTDGDVIVDKFMRAEKIDTKDFHWMWGDFVFHEQGLVMNYTAAAPASYTVTSDTNGNVSTQYAYLSASIKGSDGTQVAVQGILPAGGETEAVAFNDLTLSDGSKAALTDKFVLYHIDLGKAFGTTRIKGVKVTGGAGEGWVSLNALKFSTFDYAPYGFGSAGVDIDLDLDMASEYAFYDFTAPDQPGGSLNWVFSRGSVPDLENKSMTMTHAGDQDAYYQSSPKNGANYSGAYDYLVMEISGEESANDNFEVCIFSDRAGSDYWIKVPNLYKAPGVSAGQISAERATFIVDLAANSKTYMGLHRAAELCDGLRFRTVGDTSVTIHSLRFANAKAPARPIAYAYANGGDAKLRFSVGNDKLTGVTGEDITANDYSFAEGVLTVKKEFLTGKGAGTYLFTATFEMAGEVAFTVEVAEVETPGGDDNGGGDNGDGGKKKGCGSEFATAGGLAGLAAVALVLGCVLAVKRRKAE